MKNIIIFSSLIIIALSLLTSCADKELACTSNCNFPRTNTDRQTCEFICSPTWGELVNAGGWYCTRPGNFVAFLPKEDHLDTFSLNVTKFSFGFDHEFLYREDINAKYGTGFSYKNLSYGDSIVIDFMQPADFAFNLASGPGNRYSSDEYRLRFEGFIPDGWDDGEVMHATVHYWTLVDNPVRPSIEFDMIKVTESID